MRKRYPLPQFVSVEKRIQIIKHHLDDGLTFAAIGVLFGGVGASTIKYHWRRYAQGEKRWEGQKERMAREEREKEKIKKDPFIEYIKELAKAELL